LELDIRSILDNGSFLVDAILLRGDHGRYKEMRRFSKLYSEIKAAPSSHLAILVIRSFPEVPWRPYDDTLALNVHGSCSSVSHLRQIKRRGILFLRTSLIPIAQICGFCLGLR
jgi:hypothetical protein